MKPIQIKECCEERINGEMCVGCKCRNECNSLLSFMFTDESEGINFVLPCDLTEKFVKLLDTIIDVTESDVIIMKGS